MLSSYDVVSKSIPGVVVSAVAVSLYPDSTDVLSIPIGNNLADYALILFAFGYQGLVGFLTTYLVEAKAASPETASLAFGGFFAVGLLSQVVSGGVAATYGRRTLLVGTVAFAVVGIVVLTMLPPTAALVLTPVLGIQLGVWPVLNAYAYEALSAGARGGGFGFLRTVYLLLGSIGPVVVGTLFDTGLSSAGVGLCAATFAVVILVCARLPVLD